MGRRVDSRAVLRVLRSPAARGPMSPFRLVPRDNNFFKEFISLAEEVRSGARVLKQMIASDPPDISKVEEIKEIEHTCDRCTRAIIDRLNRTFVTPLDREDIHALAGSLDDVMLVIATQVAAPVIAGPLVFSFCPPAPTRRTNDCPAAKNSSPVVASGLADTYL